MEKLLELYKQWKGAEPLTTEKLPGAGSNRAYYRMTDTEGKSVIGGYVTWVFTFGRCSINKAHAAVIVYSDYVK